MTNEFLKRLSKTKSDDDVKRVMRTAKPDDIKAVIDLTVKIMSKKVPLGKKYIKLIMENRRTLRHLVHPKYSSNSKKRYFIQRGGTLGAVTRAARKMEELA